ncbi:hypothetical protein [Streptomyces sp. TOR3209]|uniref:hypothetical protein n=1 Tax=Streptomyces sp. TOR3209 TaxID=1073567 RepID=UPI0002EC2E95|nr:hypothetical protein [Streptomyces sp. TOR3209]
MKTNPISQHGAAVALVQLLEEHPELSRHLTWSVPRTGPGLVGIVHDDGVRVLADCRRFLGGSVQVGREHESGGVVVRQHVLASVWRDVSVEILVSLPVAAEAVAA